MPCGRRVRERTEGRYRDTDPGLNHWPGVHGLSALLNGRVWRARRPLHFFRPDGDMPDEVELSLTIPPELGPAAEVIAELHDRVRGLEKSALPQN